MPRALFITPSARQWLRHTQTARVLNRFERACNLANPQDAILSIVTSQRGLTPFSIVIPSADPEPFRGLDDASPVRVTGDRLLVGPLEIELAGAAEWDPVPDWPGLARFFARDPTLLPEFSAMALELAAKRSLLDLYRAPGTSAEGEAALERAVVERARGGARALVEGLRGGSVAAAVQGAKALAGLGSGLTPAGDDFIVGTFLAVWCGLFGPGREAGLRPIAEVASALTTTLSGAYLHAAARGECIAHWHTLLAALPGGDREVIRMAAISLMSIGHSSGADALAGFIAVERFTREG